MSFSSLVYYDTPNVFLTAFFLVSLCPLSLLCFRAHSNGSIRRGFKTDTSEAVTMRSGLGVNLKDVTVFNRGREKGKGSNALASVIYTLFCFPLPSVFFAPMAFIYIIWSFAT